MFAAHYGLDNLTAIVDNKGLQIDGKITEVCSPEPIPAKFEAFGWRVFEADAHDFNDLDRVFREAERVTGQPVAIIQHSVKGKGVSFMEHNNAWHKGVPNAQQYAQATEELEALINE